MGITDIQALPKHSRRVESWVYAVLNPLIESLRSEVFLLNKRNLSWRSYSRHCEFIRPVAEYIEGRYLPVYEDFLADDEAGFKSRFDEHDSKLAAAEAAASRAYRVLIESEGFRKQVQHSFEEYESRVGSHQSGYHQSLVSAADSLPRMVAEYLVNRVDELPYHFSTQKFWEDHRTQFQRFQENPAFDALNRAATEFNESSGALRDDLVTHRLYLCRTHDIPAAPLTARRSSGEDAGAF